MTQTRASSRAKSTPPIPPSKTLAPNETSDANENNQALYHPHTLTALVILLSWLFFAATRSNQENTELSVKYGILAAICCFVFIGMVQLRDGPFLRPSIPFWRAVLSLSILYQLLLVFFLFMNKDDARRLMKYYDPELGVELPERSYADNCELTWDTVKGQMDVFVLAHALGWYGKSIIVRDNTLCWILSIGFELLEYSLQHQLNNFAECWWDHWILDVLVCNWAGIYLGMKTCQYFEMKEYSWVGFRQIKSLRGKAKRAVQQFTPHDWTRFEWKATSSLKNYFGTLGFLVVFLQTELNCFYLKYLLWVPPEHPLNTYRLVLLFLFGLPATRDAYQLLSDKNTKRLGVHAWLLICNVMTETMICVKFSEGEFPTPAPLTVKVLWSIFLLVVVVIFPLWRFVANPVKHKVINKCLPLIGVTWSLAALYWTLRGRQRTRLRVYRPLNSCPESYGSIGDDDSYVSDNDHDMDDRDTSCSEWASSSDSSGFPQNRLLYTRMILAGGHILICAVALQRILTNRYPIDRAVEYNRNHQLWVNEISMAFWIYVLILTITLLYTSRPLALTIFKHTNWLVFLNTSVNVVNVRSFYLVYQLDSIQAGYCLQLISLVINLTILWVIIHQAPRAGLTKAPTSSGRVLSSEKSASMYSRYTFSWVNCMMKKAKSQSLNDEDLLELLPENRTRRVLADYRAHTSQSMGWSLLKTFWPILRKQMVFGLIWTFSLFGPPYFLNKIIKFIEKTNTKDNAPVSTAMVYVFGLLLTCLSMSISYQQALYMGRTMGIRTKSIVIGEVFNKALKVRQDKGPIEKERMSELRGNVNNIISVDAEKLGEAFGYAFYIYCFPMQVVLCLWGLYRLLGVASLYGVLVMLVSQPIAILISLKFEQLHRAVMTRTDRRMNLMNELISAIRIVKFFAWEEEFRTRVTAARGVELKAIRARLFMCMWMDSFWFLIPVLTMVAVFYVYTAHEAFTVSTAFTALALFNTFKLIFEELPVIISYSLLARVSLGRIEHFLAQDQVQASPTKSSHVYIGFARQACFGWDPAVTGQAILRDLDVAFPPRQLSIVCGPTGSGKSTMIASLLDETHCYHGDVILPRLHRNDWREGGATSGIAYVTQTPWLQNASIRDNILFGRPLDAKRYANVLFMTALTRDLEMLEHGDATEVGEKGIALSGGQKQRVAIARAVYSQAEIVLLDDCLSAVDAHIARHLYEHCLCGEYMNSRAIILVTHHVGLCAPRASYLVVLDEGRVKMQGSAAQVIQSGVLGDIFTRPGTPEKSRETSVATGSVVALPATSIKGGKLVKEEARAQGNVSLSVYKTYMEASGGYCFWVLILVVYGLTQASIVSQDYWIKIWSAACEGINKASMGTLPVHIFTWTNLEMWAMWRRPTPERSSEPVNVNYYLGIYILLGMLSFFLVVLRSLVLFLGSLRASRTIHARLLDRVLHAKVHFFDTTPVGRIINRFSSDLEAMDQSVATTLSQLIYTLIAAAYVIILISVATPAFLFPGIVIAVIFWRVGRYYIITSRDLKRLNAVSRSPIYVQFSESIQGVATIRAFGCQRRFIEENHDRIDCNNRSFLWMWATNRWMQVRADAVGGLVSFCAGLVMILSRSWVDPGMAGLSLSYSLMFTRHIMWFLRTYAINEMNGNAIERLCEYLDLEPEAPNPAGNPVPHHWPDKGVVQVKDLKARYGPDGPAVLRGITFTTRPREKIGIVGRTGSGKSTLALCFFRFLEALQGSIAIDGVDISTIGLTHLRSRLTIIPQDPILFSGTLRSNLDPFGQHSDDTLWAALARAHLVDQDQRHGTITLDTPVNENGSNWSQGQRQLIALARALVKQPSLIILDEATSSVDFATDHHIQHVIRTQFMHATLLCIAHRIRTVIDYDRILVLDHGRVVEFDSPFNLMTSPGSTFRYMCEQSGEYPELLAMCTENNELSNERDLK